MEKENRSPQEDIDAMLPGGSSLYERLLEYAKGAMTQRPDHFDPETRKWSEDGKEKMKYTYAVGATPEQFDQILERVERSLSK